jgi:hypothetical protein
LVGRYIPINALGSYLLHLTLKAFVSVRHLSYSKVISLINMASPILESQPTAPHQLSSSIHKVVDRKIFPDGIKTSGQHPPLYDALRPYSDFPKEITGPTVWKAKDYITNPESWVHDFSEEEIEELSTVADKFLADGIPLTGISQVSCYCLLVTLRGINS